MIFPADFEQRLGFDQLRLRLTTACLSPMGQAEIARMAFDTDRGAIEAKLRQGMEFKSLIERAESYPQSHYHDPAEFFALAEIDNAFLEEEAFQRLLLSVQTIFAWQTFLLEREESLPMLSRLSKPLALAASFLAPIATRFDEAGKLKDNASPELQRLRKRLREEEGRVRKLVDHLFRQAVGEGWVPEGATITIREGRPAIPILAEHKRRLRGFILDESATGQTVFMEPAEALEAGNEIRDLQHEERREIIRILRDLTRHVQQHLPDLRHAFDFLGQMDAIRAKAKLALELDASMPLLAEGPALQWRAARHPLLYLAFKKDRRTVVPLEIALTPGERFLVISGPNAGGKSVCLKTVGLVQYMLQCGLLVPMHPDSTMGFFDSLFLDIGDQQSIENDLSTYSSHLRNMHYFIARAQATALVLMDELGGGTDPNFGGGIAEAVLDSLVQKGVWGVATTHYYNLKVFASKTPGMRNGAMLFDVEKLEPLFQLEIGKPGSSFALEIARKTGLQKNTLDRAELIIGKELIGLEQLMLKVEEEKRALQVRLHEVAQKETALARTLAHYQTLTGDLEANKKNILNKAKEEAAHLLRNTNREIEKTIRHIRENKAQKEETRKVRESLKELSERVSVTKPTPLPKLAGAIATGDRVRMAGQEVTGVVLSIKGTQAQVQFGDLRSTVKLALLERVGAGDGKPAAPKSPPSLNVIQRNSQFSPSLDVRGKRVDEIIPIVERFLDDAILSAHGELRILHGKGEGVLRKVIRDYLRANRAVASVADEHVERGGDGLTVVVLK
ncbi:MAG: Smr/MutS family protein [Cyclobacteriaceae bacterium]|jgi:DNA mismatch repair protein MutS2|nr:Smr/MutS family protein [Cyclobacteriaceae bacterium]